MYEDREVPPPSLKHYVREMRETAEVFGWVWSEFLTNESRKRACVMLFFLGGSMFAFMLQPLAFSWMVNALQDSRLQGLVIGGLSLLSIMFIRWGCDLTRNRIREQLWNGDIIFRLYTRVNDLFNEKSLGQHAGDGTILNYASLEKAINRVQNVIELLMFEAGGYVLSLFMAYILLLWIDPVAAVLATVLVVAHVGWSIYLNYRVALETTPIEKEFRAHHRQMVERWDKIVRVKTSGKIRQEGERMSLWFARILADDCRFWLWFHKFAMTRECVGVLVSLLIIARGTYLVYIGEVDIGFLVPLYTWTIKLAGDLWYIGHAERRLNEQVPYIRGLREVLTLPRAFDEYEGVPLKHETPIGIRIVGISHAFEEQGSTDLLVLKDISFAISPGEKVALIGPSGAGKTTIMKLVLRFTDPTSGEIWVNGNRLNELSLASWMEHVGYIPQQAQIFDGTLRYNLTFGLSEERQRTITDAEIWEVMRLLKIDFGARLTNGLDTVVGRDGIKLSGGQAQRLMIGAAVIKKPIFMVIDEATSSLDSSTEKAVQEGLQAVLQGPVGALIVAHRLSTVRQICNKFLVLRPLEEVGEGESQIEATASSFEELYQTSPTFRRLANDQGVIVHSK